MSRGLSRLVHVLALLLACSSPSPVVPPDPRGVRPARVLADGLAVTAVDGYAAFERLSYRDGGLVLPGRTLKFLIDRRDPAQPVVYFMNQNYTDASGARPESAKYHFPLAERVLPNFSETLKSFGAVTYDTLEKRYVAGSIQTYFVDGAKEPLFGVQFFPQDVVKDGLVVEVVRAILPQVRLPNARFAFVATGIQQTLRAEDRRELEALGAAPRSLDEVLGAIDYIPLNRGTALGFLRVFPKDHDALSPLDIAVFDELPLDLSVVAGTITKDYQDPTSHVNLKSKERGTPNMVLRSASAEGELAKWRDQPVKMTVEVDGFRLEASTEAEVRAHHAKRNSTPWVALPYRPSDELPSFSAMCPSDPADCLALTTVVGGKAASLGFLNHRDVLGRVTDDASLSHTFGYDIAPDGVGVPFKLYEELVDHPANWELREAISALVLAIKRGDLAPKELSGRAEQVRGLFLAATFPPGSVERVAKRIGDVLPGVPKVKVRSSANAEDMPNFDGAGLYASFAANLKKKARATGGPDDEVDDGPCTIVSDGVKSKVKPKTLACAMKAVFASTWNKRAIEERTFARLDHATASMGLAIVADYELEEPVAANAVVVTRVLATPNVYGYTLALQRGNVLVTNPEPGTLAESTIAAFNEPGEPPSFAVTRFATPVAGEPALRAPVLSDSKLRELVEITRTAEIAYCRARPDYYEHDCRYAPADPTKIRALDFELKILASGRFVCKQMREFSGR